MTTAGSVDTHGEGLVMVDSASNVVPCRMRPNSKRLFNDGCRVIHAFSAFIVDDGDCRGQRTRISKT